MAKIERIIKQKEAEIAQLKKQLAADKNSKYNYLIGKYFSLACTCKIKITGIIDANDRYLIIECVRIQGRNADGNIEVIIQDDYSLSYDDIDRCIDEITEDKFKLFLSDSIEQTISAISTLIYKGNQKKG